MCLCVRECLIFWPNSSLHAGKNDRGTTALMAFGHALRCGSLRVLTCGDIRNVSTASIINGSCFAYEWIHITLGYVYVCVCLSLKFGGMQMLSFACYQSFPLRRRRESDSFRSKDFWAPVWCWKCAIAMSFSLFYCCFIVKK